MAILVALSFFFLLVSENMPASARVSIVGRYYAITMIEMTVSFFLNVLVLRFHHMTDEKVPDWVKVRLYRGYYSRHGTSKIFGKTKSNSQIDHYLSAYFKFK